MATVNMYRKCCEVWTRGFCFTSGRGEKYCYQHVCISVYLFVCLFICRVAHLKTHTSKFHLIFCTCYLQPWLGAFLTAMRYVMYFRFWLMTSCSHIMQGIDQNQIQSVCFAQFTRWRHRGEVCRLQLHPVETCERTDRQRDMQTC